MVNQLRYLMERNGFEVIGRIADRFGLRASKLRILFIYTTFFTLGITFVLYIFTAFLLWIKDGFVKKRKSVFDL